MAITFHPNGKVTGNDLIVAGYGAFRAHRNGNQTLNHNTHTTVMLKNLILKDGIIIQLVNIHHK